VDRRDRLIGELSRDALERAVQRTQRQRSLTTMDESLTSTLAQAYWQSFSGMLALLATWLPTAPLPGPHHDER